MLLWSRAYEYATEFLKEMNPDGWDGTGEQPVSFKSSVIWEKPQIYYDDRAIEIVFEYDEHDGGWKTYIDYTQNGESIDMIVVRSINNADKIARAMQRMLGLVKNALTTAKFNIIDDNTHQWVESLPREEAVKKYGDTEIVGAYTSGGYYGEWETDVWLDIKKIFWNMYGIE